MEMIGRVTADALARTTTAGKQVVQFQIAINDSYKATNGELKQLTTFIRCSWWRSANVVKVLRKGALISLSGRLSASAYLNKGGTPTAQNECNVSSFKLHAKPDRKRSQETTPMEPADIIEPLDDLPF